MAMTISPAPLWIVGILLAPALLALGLFYIWRWRVSLRGERIPVAEKLLRPAGESSRRAMEKLEEQLPEQFIAMVVGPTLGACAALWLTSMAPQFCRIGASLLTWAVAFAFTAKGFLALLRERRDRNLGFHGERAVAEELNQLLRDGCHVFHDVPMEPYGNIDHVIVAPSGVYAVETKTRRKRKLPNRGRQKDHEVIFDGKALQFPTWRDTDALDQARLQANHLRVWLSKAVGEKVQASPILTLPGWWVTDRVGTGAVRVLNPKSIGQAVLQHWQNGRSLDSQLTKRIVQQLDQKCRDVQL
jgi:hypothetical protein